MIRYIQNEAHYTEVIERIRNVQRRLWIGTAYMKDLYVKNRNTPPPIGSARPINSTKR